MTVVIGVVDGSRHATAPPTPALQVRQIRQVRQVRLARRYSTIPRDLEACESESVDWTVERTRAVYTIKFAAIHLRPFSYPASPLSAETRLFLGD
jgi:hypothetical protein